MLAKMILQDYIKYYNMILIFIYFPSNFEILAILLLIHLPVFLLIYLFILGICCCK